MTGRVCAKHEEFCPDGVCRWCEPEENIEHVPVEDFVVAVSAAVEEQKRAAKAVKNFTDLLALGASPAEAMAVVFGRLR